MPMKRAKQGAKKFRLADVDGTVPGVAMLVSANLAEGENASPSHSTWG